MKKCELVCANCHQIRTVSRIETPVDLFCRTYKQKNTKRFDRTAVHTIGGNTLSIQEWADRFGIPVVHVARRIAQNGWSVDRALTTPLRKRSS